MEVKLSVIIPCHKASRWLVELLASIPTCHDIEVILVDDSEEQDIESRIERLNHNVKIFCTGGRKGGGYSRNMGLDFSLGKFIIFSDSDDYFCKEFFETVSDYFNEDYDVVYFSPTSTVTDTGKMSTRHLVYEKLVKNYFYHTDDKIKYDFYVPWSKLIKSDFMKKNNIRFDEIVASNDINHSLLLGLRSSNIKADLRVIYCVREHSRSLTKSKRQDVLRSRIYAIKRYNDILRKEGLQSYQRDTFLYLRYAMKIGFRYFLRYSFYVVSHKEPIVRGKLKRMISEGFSRNTNI